MAMRLIGYNGKSAMPSYCRLIMTVSNWVSVGVWPLNVQPNRKGQAREPGMNTPVGQIHRGLQYEVDIGGLGSHRVLFGKLALLLGRYP